MSSQKSNKIIERLLRICLPKIVQSRVKKFVIFFLPLSLYAVKGELEPTSLTPILPEPWFTGPLLTPSGDVVETGHQNYEPYVYWTRNTGNYNSHWKPVKTPTFTNVLTQGTMQIGIFPAVELNLAPQFSYNNTQGQRAWRVNDFPIIFGFQLYSDVPETWYPAVKLRLSLNTPLGKYDRLNPKKLGTDVGGDGSWTTHVGVVFSRAFNVYQDHFMSWRLFLDYRFPTPVHVHGLSVYNGAPATRGTVYPGQTFLVLQGVEFTLTQNWVVALDIQYLHGNKRKFSGHTPPGTKPTHPSFETFSLAPAIEYNFNANVGIITGPWFTIAGRNSPRFISWIFAINIYN